jgi:thymidylate synthase (FAD)|nr:MAG TPA: Thymidylate synthase complementing protein [Caudoviricetes sp.]
MKLIKNKVEKLEQKHDLLGVYEQIEIAGRTAYKSLDKIEYDENGRSKTAKEFVDKMIKLGHGSPLEHGTVYLNVPINIDVAGNYIDNQYTVCKLVMESDKSNNWWAVTTNYRVLVENNLLNDLKYICQPTEYHELRTTFRLTCARVQADSFVRHRVFSFLMESTRYCNYNDGKFGNEITVVEPINWDNFDANNYVFVRAWSNAEKDYMELIKDGIKPEDARDVLPLQLKTELIMTGITSQWNNFFKLRISEHAHPDAKYIAEQIKEQL